MEVLTIERNHLNLSPHSTASDMTSPNSSRLSDSGLFTSPPDDAIPESLPNKALSRNARAFSIDAILSNSDETEEENVEMGGAEQEEVGQEEERADDQDPLDNGDEPSLSDSTLPVDDTVFTSDRHTETRCILEMSDLWKKFHELGTEMIITKSGRRMFPSLRVSFSNLEPKARYQVYFDVTPVDNKRYRYAYHRSSWLVAGRADPPIPQRCYIHPDGPFIGESLQKQSISFEKVKLTNNVHDKWDYIVLNSMHKYQPRVHLVKLAADNSEPEKLHSVADLKGADRKVFIFTETQFIGVTAYQNQLITKLKIDSNPFAKGFRDSARITQIDRDSVDLLIKASRHAYPGAFIQQQLLHQQHINNLSPTSSYASSPSKFPSLHPPLPLFVPPHANSGGLSKDLFRFYLEQLSSNQDMASNTNKGTNMCSLQSRFHPYNR